MWKVWRSVPTRIVKISEEANLCRSIQHSLGGRVKFEIGAITCQRESEGIFGGPFLGSLERQQELCGCFELEGAGRFGGARIFKNKARKYQFFFRQPS